MFTLIDRPLRLVASLPSPSTGTLSIGPIEIRAYGLMIALGVIAAVWLLGKQLEDAGLGTRDDASSIAVWGVAAGVIGARGYHVVTDWERFSGGLASIPKIWEGGLGIPGGLLAGVWVGIWQARRRGIRPAVALTFAAPAIALAQSIGRWGNWFNQELYGRPTSLPWALEIDDPSGYPSGTSFHPVFLYESLWNLALCVSDDRPVVQTTAGLEERVLVVTRLEHPPNRGEPARRVRRSEHHGITDRLDELGATANRRPRDRAERVEQIDRSAITVNLSQRREPGKVNERDRSLNNHGRSPRATVARSVGSSMVLVDVRVVMIHQATPMVMKVSARLKLGHQPVWRMSTTLPASRRSMMLANPPATMRTTGIVGARWVRHMLSTTTRNAKVTIDRRMVGTLENSPNAVPLL